MLGKHLGGSEDAIRTHLADGDDTLAFPKQVRENADVADGHARPPVRDAEAGREPSKHRHAFQAPLLHKATKADDLTLPRRLGDQLRRRLEEDEVASERDQGQRRGASDPHAAEQDNEKTAALPGHDCHDCSPPPPVRACRGPKAPKRAFA